MAVAGAGRLGCGSGDPSAEQRREVGGGRREKVARGVKEGGSREGHELVMVRNGRVCAAPPPLLRPVSSSWGQHRPHPPWVLWEQGGVRERLLEP